MSRTIYWQIVVSDVEINQSMNPKRDEVFNQMKNKVQPLIFHNKFTFIYTMFQSNASRLMILHRYQLSWGCKIKVFCSFWCLQLIDASRFSSYLECSSSDYKWSVKNYALMCWKKLDMQSDFETFKKKRKKRFTPFFKCLHS